MRGEFFSPTGMPTEAPPIERVQPSFATAGVIFAEEPNQPQRPEPCPHPIDPRSPRRQPGRRRTSSPRYTEPHLPTVKPPNRTT